MKIRSGVVLFTAISAITAGTQAAATETSGWQYEFTPYVLAAGMSGDAGVRGVTTDVDMSFSDILDDLQAGFMGQFSARKGPWALGLEAVYMGLEDDGSGRVSAPGGIVSVGGKLEVESDLYVYQGTVGYRVLDKQTKVDVLGAVRYTKLDTDARVSVQFTPGIVFPGGKARASGSESWADFVVGALVLHPVSDTVALIGYADVGGGGSDLTYQFIAGANWEFKKDFIAKIGYRYLSWDYENDGTVWDMVASGPYLGLGIRF